MNDLLFHTDASGWKHLLTGGTLLTLRLGGVVAFAPPFNSAAISPRVKSAFTLAIVLLLTPIAAGLPHARVEMSAESLLGEIGTGVIYGFTLLMLQEAVLFAGALLSMNFSFSLANLMDPNSRVETQVLGELVNWIAVLVLFGAGLHRVVLASVMRSVAVVPLGSAVVKLSSIHALVEMASGIFLAGLQLCAPVLSAAMVVEVATALVGRLAPALPTQVLSVPVKTMVAYCVLIAALGVWPRWIEGHFAHLLDAAQRMVLG